MLDVEVIRKYFPFTEEKISIIEKNNTHLNRLFLDSTASAQISLPVLEKLVGSVFNYANIHRGEYNASLDTTEDFERTYNVSANLVNAKSWREIILGRNTTEMINLVMRSLQDEFANGDNIVTTRLEHNSNYVPWHALQQKMKKYDRQLEVRLVDFNPDTGEIDMPMMKKLVDKKTKLVAVTGASNFLGVKPDLKKIGEIAHSSGYIQPQGKKGSHFLVDAAQLITCNYVDTQAIDCDFLAWSFHKMSIPLGVGGLYAKQEIMESLDPFLFGGDMVEDVKEGEVRFKPLPWKYTAGTPNILSTIATPAGINFLINAGLDNIIDTAKKYDTHYIDEKICNQIQTEILLNTPRGDYHTPFIVPEKHQSIFREYLKNNPLIAAQLREQDKRILLAQNNISQSMSNICRYEQGLIQYAIDSLKEIPGVRMYGPDSGEKRVGLLAFTIDNMSPQTTAFELNRRGIEVRNGTHCASLAHNYLGLDGSVRLSVYIYTKQEEISKTVDAIKEISNNVGN